jgi:ketosteroid isomerase-like protein
MNEPSPEELIEIARQYLAAIERGAPFAEIARFITEDCVQEELPNRFLPNGAKRNVEDLEAAAVRGSKAVENQRFEVLSAVAQGTKVALEIRWSAQVLGAIGSLKPGDTMVAHFAFFLEFRGDRICSQRNYDCFEPF